MWRIFPTGKSLQFKLEEPEPLRKIRSCPSLFHRDQSQDNEYPLYRDYGSNSQGNEYPLYRDQSQGNEYPLHRDYLSQGDNGSNCQGSECPSLHRDYLSQGSEHPPLHRDQSQGSEYPPLHRDYLSQGDNGSNSQGSEYPPVRRDQSQGDNGQGRENKPLIDINWSFVRRMRRQSQKERERKRLSQRYDSQNTKHMDTTKTEEAVCSSHETRTTVMMKAVINNLTRAQFLEMLDENKTWTTVMMRAIPNNLTRTQLVEMLDKNGFKGEYDFVYLPFDFQRKANLGYSFVNLVNKDAAIRLRDTFEGFTKWVIPTFKVCQVSWALSQCQGFDANVKKYRNNGVMHQDVPDEYKPLIFKDGESEPFPKPTIQLRSPFECR